MTDYYVDAVSGKDNNKGTEKAPWQTLAKVTNFALQPGDVVRLRAGQTFTGDWTPLSITRSGTKAAPITITSYGTGAAPIIDAPGEWRWAVTINAQYVVMDGLHVQRAGEIGIYAMSGAAHCVIRNCEVDNCGMGIYVNCDAVLVTGCYLHDGKMVVNTPGGDDDYGANGIWLAGGTSHEISYNHFKNLSAPSQDYGSDGGCIECYGDIYSAHVHHNYGELADGFMELGQGHIHDAVVHHNILRNVYRALHCNLAGTIYAADIQRFRFEHNVYVETRDKWQVVNLIAGTVNKEQLQLRNNVFYGPRRLSPNDSFTHEYNLYFGVDQPLTLGKGEIKADPLFVDVDGGDYHLQAGSPAIDAGTDLGYTSDYDDEPMPNGAAPDMGAFEHGISGTPILASLTRLSIRDGQIAIDTREKAATVLDVTAKETEEVRSSLETQFGHGLSDVYLDKPNGKLRVTVGQPPDEDLDNAPESPRATAAKDVLSGNAL